MVLHGAMFVLAVRARVEHPILYLKVRVYSIEIQIKTDEQSNFAKLSIMSIYEV